jgi:hypothetical protein
MVRPESVFWVATSISMRSLTGGTWLLAKQRKYLFWDNKKIVQSLCLKIWLVLSRGGFTWHSMWASRSAEFE